FVSKLFAEVVEEMNPKQVEAVRATGANFWNTLIFAVMPQVMARFVGLSVYQLDSNLRNSTMVGIVGGGGIGAPLFTAYQRFDYDVVLTILICIIAIIMTAELISGRIRRIFQ
ncbi:MAG: PhnE/PtxC family ABC transporter permease, partial [Beijerinckiaceae bacterium]